MLRGGAIALSTLICAALLAQAGERLPIDGTYGNEAGCKLAKTGNYGEDDSARILTATSLETMVTACNFDQVRATTDGNFGVAMTCASEGEGPEGNYGDTVDIAGNSVAGYVVRFKDGNTWGPLNRCG